jgi:hypothetical protein
VGIISALFSTFISHSASSNCRSPGDLVVSVSDYPGCPPGRDRQLKICIKSADLAYLLDFRDFVIFELAGICFSSQCGICG